MVKLKPSIAPPGPARPPHSACGGLSDTEPHGAETKPPTGRPSVMDRVLARAARAGRPAPPTMDAPPAPNQGGVSDRQATLNVKRILGGESIRKWDPETGREMR